MVPFRDDRAGAARTLAALARLELREGDELRLADNSDGGVLAEVAASGLAPGAVIVRATGERSSYHARNTGARGARGEWLLFLDADCTPDPALLDAYFSAPPPPRCAVLAGRIDSDESQSALIARYARDRKFFSQTDGLHRESWSAAATGNVLVRRAAFEAVGGFVEGIRSAGDVDLCWRLRDAGWELEYRPGARVVHHHRESLVGILGQIARYAAGARWLDARHPGSSPRWPLIAGIVGSARDVAVNAANGRFEEATFRTVDALGLIAHNAGYLASNRAARQVI